MYIKFCVTIFITVREEDRNWKRRTEKNEGEENGGEANTDR